ncbi:MAG: hypothetical protein HQK54_07480 [Oligoflexales bacterium]|nr:hypothetical protein [Oligoflexales bacterium]
MDFIKADPSLAPEGLLGIDMEVIRFLSGIDISSFSPGYMRITTQLLRIRKSNAINNPFPDLRFPG